jgi:hypothetical protein
MEDQAAAVPIRDRKNDQSIVSAEVDREPSPKPPYDYAGAFPQHWLGSTLEDKISRYGFRRFQTSQLLNIRFLENEVAELDRSIYKAGLRLNLPFSSSTDRFGPEHVVLDHQSATADKIITHENVLKLRRLLKDYSM